MPAISKSDLLRPRVSSADPYDTYITLEDGEQVFIRPLTRAEQLTVHEEQQEHGIAHAECLMLSLAMVDPALTRDEVALWMNDPGAGPTIAVISRGIGVISGLVPGAGKEAYKSV